MKLAELTWPDVEKLDRDIVVIYPVAALEQHSRHLPFFTDSILCEAIAARIESALADKVLLLPLQWLGASTHHLGMAGTLTAENQTFIQLVSEPARCLLRAGFKRILILNGHGGNADGIHLALRQLTLEFPTALLGAASYWELAEKEAAAILQGPRKTMAHACEYETSLMLSVRPDLVRRNEMADDQYARRVGALDKVYFPTEMKLYTRQGGSGFASLATAKTGEAILAAVIKNAVETVKAFRTEALPNPGGKPA